MLLRRGAGLSVGQIGMLAAIYPAVWGVGQLVTGALSDRVGRKWLIVGGMWIQAVAHRGDRARRPASWPWRSGAVLLGVGTAMVYPTLLAAIGDVAHPRWRASAVGVYRLWRDAGFAVGAVLAGVIADAFGVDAAIWTVAALTACSGLVVAVFDDEDDLADEISASASERLRSWQLPQHRRDEMDAHAVKAFFESVAGDWDEMRATFYNAGVIDAVLLDNAAIDTTTKVVDVGTGTGFVAASLAVRLATFVGVDHSPAMLRVAR